MKKLILGLLLQAFIFVVVHDYVIESIDNETQSELYLYAAGQLAQPSDVSKNHEILHDCMLAMPLLSLCTPKLDIQVQTHFSIPQVMLSISPQSIYHPPIV